MPRINLHRLLARLEELGTIGAIEGTNGVARLALTDADKAGRDLVVSWMRDLDLDVRIDAIGNVVAATGGEGNPVLCGSHIDTVRTGGRYDGNYGVLAGLEVIETLREHNLTPPRPLGVAFFTDEEGARFAPDMLGSLVFAGGLPVEHARNIVGIDGTTVGAELDRIGYSGSMPCPMMTPHAFVELHVEQGPVLEAEGFSIGAVTGVQGISWQEVVVSGQSNHAGTTPMHMRRDPLYAAAQMAAFVRALALDIGGSQVGTVGKFDVYPNLVNVVAQRVTFTVDLRNTDEESLRKAEHRFEARLDEIARNEGVTVTTRSLARFEPVAFDERVVALVESVAAREGLRTRRLPSGAGHDAQMLARLCPAAMIFVPSHKGLSHNVAEHTDASDLEAGANVLAQVLWQLATAGVGSAAVSPASEGPR